MATYRYDHTTGGLLRLCEKTGKWKKDRKTKDRVCAPSVMADIRPFISRATDKPVEITSRSQLARYERSNNIRQCGDFRSGEIETKRKRKIRAEIAEATKHAGVPLSSVQWSDFR